MKVNMRRQMGSGKFDFGHCFASLLSLVKNVSVVGLGSKNGEQEADLVKVRLSRVTSSRLPKAHTQSLKSRQLQALQDSAARMGQHTQVKSHLHIERRTGWEAYHSDIDPAA